MNALRHVNTAISKTITVATSARVMRLLKPVLKARLRMLAMDATPAPATPMEDGIAPPKFVILCAKMESLRLSKMGAQTVPV
jgi:hypothetical protein